MKPIIAITVESKFDPETPRSRGKLELNWNYPEEIVKAGGVPIIVAPMADMAELAPIVDGWLIPGGADINSSEWGEELHPEAEVQDGTRFNAEKQLFTHLDPQVPILGICYGAQALNVLHGGSLEQHVPDRTGHEHHSGGTPQDYTLDESSRLARMLGQTKVHGPSYHHQAIARLGEGISAVGHHDDGTIEAIEANGSRWLFGLQCHPERAPGENWTQTLFREFIQAAAAYRQTKEVRHR
ncbi:MAG: gamma-glutamyl-gamma-aminobutyrate hydrolase family protein [Armatimonadetes bacterium]|nr:gamma-glutamyl-gamma-aminobutyrate hydrolase family protein [Armatimonadota bacterium]